MDKQSRTNLKKPLTMQLDPQYVDLESILESDLEDYEVAAELNMSVSQVSKIRRELFEE